MRIETAEIHSVEIGLTELNELLIGTNLLDFDEDDKISSVRREGQYVQFLSGKNMSPEEGKDKVHKHELFIHLLEEGVFDVDFELSEGDLSDDIEDDFFVLAHTEAFRYIEIGLHHKVSEEHKRLEDVSEAVSEEEVTKEEVLKN